MFVFTFTKKKTAKFAAVSAAAVIAVAVGISAMMSSLGSGASEKQHPIYKVDRSDNKVALTFDAAFGNSNTDGLLKILSDTNTPATFFVTGEFADKHPEDIGKIALSGHEIGNNSDTHIHLIENGKPVNVNALIADTHSAASKIAKVTGTEPALYRSPYGEYDDNILTTLRGMSLTPIQYSVDSLDWQEPPAEVIEKRVLDGTTSGSIILLHNDIANTEAALPNIISKLRARGVEFVTVSNLIYHGDYTVDNTGKQIPNARDAFNPAADAALEIAVSAMKQVMTKEQAAETIKSGVSPAMASKLAAVLTTEQIKLLRSADPALVMAMYNGTYSAPVMASIADVPESGQPGYGKGGAVGKGGEVGEAGIPVAAGVDSIPVGGEPGGNSGGSSGGNSGGSSGGGGVAQYITSETESAEATTVPDMTTVGTETGTGGSAGGFAAPQENATAATAATAVNAVTTAATTAAEIDAKAGGVPKD
ncbi:hypothetical protein FACS1894133_2590 [Clostridia bacterium]|nr:hypothetical protein FACS1894133_2590 [Clostridia bacterium]